MRSTRSVRMLVLTFLSAAAACTEGPAEPVSNEDDGVASVASAATLDNFLNNPDNGNERIFRVEDQVFLILFDDTPGSTLAAVHSSFPQCGGSPVPVSLQEILHNPDDPLAGRVNVLLQATDVNIRIIDTADPGSCFGNRLVAGGTGRLQITDNDLFVEGKSSANAFGFMANATLTTPSGATAHYNAIQRTSWKVETINGTEDFIVIFDHVTENFNLKIK